jgi:hypothetical protein
MIIFGASKACGHWCLEQIPKCWLDPVISSRWDPLKGWVRSAEFFPSFWGWPKPHTGLVEGKSQLFFQVKSRVPWLGSFFLHEHCSKPHTGIIWDPFGWVILGDQLHYPENLGFSLSMKWNSRSLPTNTVGCIFNTAHCSYGDFLKCGIPETMGVNMFQYQIIPNIFSLGCFWVPSGNLT